VGSGGNIVTDIRRGVAPVDMCIGRNINIGVRRGRKGKRRRRRNIRNIRVGIFINMGIRLVGGRGWRDYMGLIGLGVIVEGGVEVVVRVAPVAALAAAQVPARARTRIRCYE